MGGVFDDRQVVASRNSVDSVQVGRQAGHVNRDDGLGMPGDGGFDEIRVEVQVSRTNINKHGLGIEVAHHFGGGGEGIGCGNHFVAPPQADGFQGQVHGRRARIDGDGVSGWLKDRKVSRTSALSDSVVVGTAIVVTSVRALRG